MQVSINGYIVLWRKRPSSRVNLPKLPPTNFLHVPLVAPFWTNITNKGGQRRSHVLVMLLRGSKRTLARAVSVDIKRKFKINYSSKKLLIASWVRVTYSGGSAKTEVRLNTPGKCAGLSSLASAYCEHYYASPCCSLKYLHVCRLQKPPLATNFRLAKFLICFPKSVIPFLKYWG